MKLEYVFVPKHIVSCYCVFDQMLLSAACLNASTLNVSYTPIWQWSSARFEMHVIKTCFSNKSWFCICTTGKGNVRRPHIRQLVAKSLRLSTTMMQVAIHMKHVCTVFTCLTAMVTTSENSETMTTTVQKRTCKVAPHCQLATTQAIDHGKHSRRCN